MHPHVEVKVVDPDTGRVVPRGASGELCTRGYSVMLGYWDEPEKTADAIDVAGWMHTGDLATMDDDGYVNIVGRIKDMIIRGGENVYPREIEEFLYTHPDIVDVQVIGVPDARYGEEVMAWVKARDGADLTTRGGAGVLRGPDRALQGAALRPGDRRVPDDGHRQGPEVQDARSRHRAPRPPGRGPDRDGVTVARMTKDAIGPASERALQGNLHKQADKLARQGKLFVRDRLDLLLDPGSFVEDGLLANALAPADDLPADGVVTGRGLIDGRPVCVMANDPTVKAGSWGARTVEKIVRLTEDALRHELPVVWLVDSAGARITDQVELFPGRRGAGRIFYNQVRLSGRVPQVCCLFGPSAAGGAYIPSFCDLVLMVEGNASMYLGSPRMAEEVIGETVTLEEMGGARMHATVSGCGDNLVVVRRRGHRAGPALPVVPAPLLPGGSAAPSSAGSRRPTPVSAAMVPDDERRGYDMHTVVDGLLDDGSFFEIKPLFAPELIVGFGRLEGNSVGVVANNPAVKGGVLFGDSADKAARFIWLSNAFNVPLVFLADVPGFMIGSQVEREGIIRHGAKMITAVSEATVPKVSVIVRKAYGAGLYAMCGPAFDAGRLPRPALGQDRRDGTRGRGERGLLQPDPGHRGPRRSGRPTSTSSAAPTRRTSTSSAWPATSSSTRSCRPRTSAGSWWPASASPSASRAPSPSATTACPGGPTHSPLSTSSRRSSPAMPGRANRRPSGENPAKFCGRKPISPSWTTRPSTRSTSANRDALSAMAVWMSGPANVNTRSPSSCAATSTGLLVGSNV